LYSRYWNGTCLQVRLMRGAFPDANDINFSLMKLPRMSLYSKLVPVQYRYYEYGLFLYLSWPLIYAVSRTLSLKLTLARYCIPVICYITPVILNFFVSFKTLWTFIQVNRFPTIRSASPRQRA